MVHKGALDEKHAVCGSRQLQLTINLLCASAEVQHGLQFVAVVCPGNLHEGDHAYPNRAVSYDHLFFARLILDHYQY